MTHRLRRAPSALRSQAGAAVVEFAAFAVIAMLPLAWGALAIQQVASIHQSAQSAAGESLRAVLTGPSESAARHRAEIAAALVLDDATGLTDHSVVVACSGACLRPGAIVRVRIDARAELPQIPVLGIVPEMTLRAEQAGVVDAYAAPG